MIRIICGDAREELRRLPDASVHMCVTSPPYWNLRDYHVAGQIGLKSTPEQFIGELVEIFREIRRILRDDGICLINLGDSYAGSWGSQGRQGNSGQMAGRSVADVRQRSKLQAARIEASVYPAKISNTGTIPEGSDYKPKDLMMMPARVAMALQADGWFLRSQMPWIKRSCMPESVTDRPASAVEYVYLLTKSQKYFWDATAVKRVGAVPAGTRAAKGSNVRSELKGVNGRPPEYWDYNGSRNFRNSDLFFDSLAPPHGLICDDAGEPIALDVNTQPFAGAHFAVFPSGLVEPLIRAGTSEKGCCAACGAPWARRVEKTFVPQPDVSPGKGIRGHDGQKPMDESNGWGGVPRGNTEARSLGWAPTCGCDALVVPCTVLDPFAGAFTSMLVADQLQRDGIGIELKSEYCEIARRRLLKDAPLLTQIAKAPQRLRLFS